MSNYEALRENAVHIYGHLIQRGEMISGQLFAERIRQTYDINDPHNEIYAKAVEDICYLRHNNNGIAYVELPTH